MFNVIAADIDESPILGECPQEYVLRLAAAKARAVARQSCSNQAVVAADTAVVDGDAILGKPVDMADAETMLRRLRGHTHQVFTGIAVLDPVKGKIYTDLCITDVPMRFYSDDEMRSYVLSGDPLDKAGAYAIQHPRFQPVEHLHGCFASVMGLPLCHLVRTLRQVGVAPSTDVPIACQLELEYQCAVSPSILGGEQIG